MKRTSTRELTLAAVVGAIYVVLGYFGNIFNLTFGVIQCRFSEALTVLPFLSPVTTWGLFIGCVITNILIPYGALDMIFGSAATLLAAVLTARCKKKWLAPLPPVLCNAVVIGALIAFQTVGFTAAFWPAFGYQALTIGAGELVACYVLGLPLMSALERLVPQFRKGKGTDSR